MKTAHMSLTTPDNIVHVPNILPIKALTTRKKKKRTFVKFQHKNISSIVLGVSNVTELKIELNLYIHHTGKS